MAPRVDLGIFPHEQVLDMFGMMLVVPRWLYIEACRGCSRLVHAIWQVLLENSGTSTTAPTQRVGRMTWAVIGTRRVSY